MDDATKPPAASPPTGQSTTKWTVSYESTTDAGFLAVQTGAGERFSEMLPNLLNTVMQGLNEAKSRARTAQTSPPPPAPPDDPSDNVFEFPGAKPWYSKAFARRLARIDSDEEKLRAMVVEFVARFDRAFERGQNPADLPPMVNAFLAAYDDRPSDAHLNETYSVFQNGTPELNERILRSLLVPAGASEELLLAASRYIGGLASSPTEDAP